MRMCYKERHPLLLKCFITFLRYTMMVQRAPDRIYSPHMIHTESFLPKITHKVGSCKMSAFGHPLCMGDGMLCYIKRHPLLIKCLLSSLRCTRIVGITFDSIYRAHYGQHCAISTANNSQISCKVSEFGYPFPQRK